MQRINNNMKCVCRSLVVAGLTFAWFGFAISTNAQEVLPSPGANPILDSPQVYHSSKSGFDVRIGDLTSVAGVRSNKITGIGLVTGLNATGGKNPETRESLLRIYERFGSRASPIVREAIRTDTQLRTGSVSVVMVTAELKAFTSAGSKINVTVSTLDDATSLQGGVLSDTPLRGFDNEVYAVAGGTIKIGGHSSGGQAASVTVNHPTVGVISDGAIVEKEVCDEQFARNGTVDLLLNEHSFENARRISDALNRKSPNTAIATNPGKVRLIVPHKIPNGDLSIYHQNVLRFVADAEQVRFVPDIPARIVINERTGTVVIGENVRISRVIFSHANLAVITGESPEVNQPAPFSQGQTAVVPRTELEVNEGSDAFRVIDEPVTVGELARALNALGATPRDLSAILLSMKSLGALHAELISE